MIQSMKKVTKRGYGKKSEVSQVHYWQLWALKINSALSRRTKQRRMCDSSGFAPDDCSHFPFYSEVVCFAAQTSYYMSLANFLFSFSG